MKLPATSFNELSMTTMEHPSAMRRQAPGYVDNGAQFGNSFSTIEAPHIDPLDFNIDEDFSLVTWLYVPPGVNPIPLIDKRTVRGTRSSVGSSPVRRQFASRMMDDSRRGPDG